MLFSGARSSQGQRIRPGAADHLFAAVGIGLSVGPVAQWKSGRLLNDWSRVRFPPGPRSIWAKNTGNRPDQGPSVPVAQCLSSRLLQMKLPELVANFKY